MGGHPCSSAGVVARSRDCKVRAAVPKRTIVAHTNGKGLLLQSLSIFLVPQCLSPSNWGNSGGRHSPQDIVGLLQIGHKSRDYYSMKARRVKNFFALV
jgi:hypothetical protein